MVRGRDIDACVADLDAARETSEPIAGSRQSAEHGVLVSQGVSDVLRSVLESGRKVAEIAELVDTLANIVGAKNS